MARLGLAVIGVLLATTLTTVSASENCVMQENGVALEMAASAEGEVASGNGSGSNKTSAENETATEKATAEKEQTADKEKTSGVKKTVDIEWYGHACFFLKAASGAWIVIDPFDTEKFPYSLPEGPVTLAFASHDHFDHNNLSAVEPEIAIKGGAGGAMVTDPLKTIPPYGTYTFSEDSTSYTLHVVPSYHDEEKGEKRGHNTISVWEIDDIWIVHLGDLGTGLEKKQVEAIGRPDVLLIPVGGYYTIDAEVAREVVGQLSPRIVVPMHFKTKALGDRLPISGVEDFLKGWKKVTMAEGSVLSLVPGELPEGPEIVLLKYHGQEE